MDVSDFAFITSAGALFAETDGDSLSDVQCCSAKFRPAAASVALMHIVCKVCSCVGKWLATLRING